MTLKSDLTCSFCSKIFKDPIRLPCDHAICEYHLKQKHKQIQCSKCSQTHDLSKNDYKPYKDTAFRCFLDDFMFLSDEEKRLKHKLESCLSEYVQVHEEFTLNRVKLEMECFTHFSEMRFQIDLHREDAPKVYSLELLKKLDRISLEMIEKVKTLETSYLKSLNEKCKSQQSNENISLINDTFRDPNVSLRKIELIYLEHAEKVRQLYLRLNELSDMKELLKTNEFRQSFENDFNFGYLYLFELTYDPFCMSQILSVKQSIDLIKLCEFNTSDKWSLLYRGTRDGFECVHFHAKCDNKSPTLIICKALHSGFVFGGYTEAEWESISGKDEYKRDSQAFTFSLINRENRPCKMRTLDASHSIFCSAWSGPTFGADFSIYIANKANKIDNCSSNLGKTYQHVKYVYNSNEARAFLAGSYHFQLSEIEVYQKE
jgi:hypothetical protein